MKFDERRIEVEVKCRVYHQPAIMRAEFITDEFPVMNTCDNSPNAKECLDCVQQAQRRCIELRQEGILHDPIIHWHEQI